MIKNSPVRYYVEGDDEKKFISVLKTEMQLIVPGRIDHLNVVEQKITAARLRTLAPNTTVVLIFDTDTGQKAILEQNIKALKASSQVAQVITIPQVRNLEDELARSCDLKDVKTLLGSKTIHDFKADLIKVTNLKSKLLQNGFCFARLWSQAPPPTYSDIENGADAIRLS